MIHPIHSSQSHYYVTNRCINLQLNDLRGRCIKLKYLSKTSSTSITVDVGRCITYLVMCTAESRSLWSPPESSGWALRGFIQEGRSQLWPWPSLCSRGSVCFWQQPCPDGPVTTCHLGMWHPLNNCAGYHIKILLLLLLLTPPFQMLLQGPVDERQTDQWRNLLLDDSAAHKVSKPQSMWGLHVNERSDKNRSDQAGK